MPRKPTRSRNLNGSKNSLVWSASISGSDKAVGHIVPPHPHASQEEWDRYERYYRRLRIYHIVLYVGAAIGGIIMLLLLAR